MTAYSWAMTGVPRPTVVQQAAAVENTAITSIRGLKVLPYLPRAGLQASASDHEVMHFLL